MVQLPSEASDSGKIAIDRLRDLLRTRKRHAGFERHGVGCGIDLANPIETLQRKNDLSAALVRRLPADEPGVSALRHDCDALRIA